MRDLVRARATARRVLGKARQHLQGFLLRHGRIYRGVRGWTRAYRRWLTTVRFDHPAQQIVLQDYIHAVEGAEVRLQRLEQQIEELLPSWSMAPVVEALQAMRGIALIVATTVVAEVGDFSRFANPRQLMAYLGLVPSEHSSGSNIRRGRHHASEGSGHRHRSRADLRVPGRSAPHDVGGTARHHARRRCTPDAYIEEGALAVVDLVEFRLVTRGFDAGL
jgi:hypothetical protein